MNPELIRNFWIELQFRRVVLMTAFLGLAFLAGAASGEETLNGVAEFLFYVIVVLWGARNAAQAVVGEIRERTWDRQRLSAIRAWPMVWGKLVGSTSFVWYGGALCLIVLSRAAWREGGADAVGYTVLYYLSIGLMAQAVALLASLVAIRRRTTISRFDVFVYQAAGVLASWWVWSFWQTADPSTWWGWWSAFAGTQVTTVAWWNMQIDARTFYLASLGGFILWTLIANWRLMRLELQMQNGPLVWLAFMAYLAAYNAGFDMWKSEPELADHAVTIRLALAGSTVFFLTYAMVLFEPKDAVLYRWLLGALGSGRFFAFLGRAQAWMYSYVATVAIAIWLIFTLGDLQLPEEVRLGSSRDVILATLGFLTRDCGIFLLFHVAMPQRKGDFAPLVTLLALYVVVPSILGSAQMNTAFLFYPVPSDPWWVGVGLAWGQALVVWAMVMAGLREGRARIAAQPA